jgi:hypothetical protein
VVPSEAFANNNVGCIFSSVCLSLSVYLSIYLSMALQPFVGPCPLFNFLILYTVGRTPWTGDQPVTSLLCYNNLVGLFELYCHVFLFTWLITVGSGSDESIY